MWKVKEYGIEASQNRGYSTCGQMSNPHDINLGTKVLIIEARDSEGRDGIGTCWTDSRETVNNGDEKRRKRTIAPPGLALRTGRTGHRKIFWLYVPCSMGFEILRMQRFAGNEGGSQGSLNLQSKPFSFEG